MKMLFRSALAAAFAGIMGVTAMAADLPSKKDEPAPVIDLNTFHPFQVRLKVGVIIPDGNSTIYDKYGLLSGLGLSSGGDGQIFGAGAKVSNSVIPELDVAYYFTRNWAVETLCCITRNGVHGTGIINGTNLGHTWVFPPTVLAQYHFTNFGAFQPYIGVGVNFTAYPWQDQNNKWGGLWVGSLGIPILGQNLNIAPSWGVAGQVGFDYMFTDQFGFNVDAKRILMEPTAYTNIITSSGAVIPVRARVNIDPWLISAGMTYRFGSAATTPVIAKY